MRGAAGVMVKSDVQKHLDMLDEMYMDPPGDGAMESETRSHRDVRELIGMCRGLLAALDAMVAARAVINVHNGKQ
jgi:hypothetical protein